ncbi:MAG: hypothetical protein ABSE35_17105 [Bryobacteraceae bacterium]
MKNPEILDQENRGSEGRNMPVGNIDGLRAQLHKLRHGMERLIDSLAEGAIEKDQFTARIDRTKTRIAEIETKIGAQATDEGRRAHVRSLMNRIAELSSHLQSLLHAPGWATKREIIRALVQRIEIGPKDVVIVLRLPTEASARSMEPIMVTLSRV